MSIHNARGFTCKNVWERGEPILYVYHDDNGDWQFLCGRDEHNDAEEAVLLHAGHVFGMHPDLLALSDLEPGESALRESTNGAWTRRTNCGQR